MHAQIIKKHITVASLTFDVAGATGVGFGSVVIGDFPEGNVLMLGAVSYMQFSGPGGDAGLVDTWVGDYGIGTTPASDGTISVGDEDIIAETALAAATAEVGLRTRATGATATNAAVFDNTDGSLEINVNLLIDDASIRADDITFTLIGDLHISYIMLGDD